MCLCSLLKHCCRELNCVCMKFSFKEKKILKPDGQKNRNQNSVLVLINIAAKKLVKGAGNIMKIKCVDYLWISNTWFLVQYCFIHIATLLSITREGFAPLPQSQRAPKGQPGLPPTVSGRTVVFPTAGMARRPPRCPAWVWCSARTALQ